MPNTGGILLGPGPLAKAVARPYDTTTAWQNGQYCAREGKIYKFIGEDLLAGESWNASHWAETKVTDEVTSLQAQIDNLDPETGTALFTDVAFTINSNQWTESSGTYSFNFSNALIKSNSGIQAFYTESFRTALSGDVYVEPHTGYATFITDGQPQGALSGTLRIIDSVSGTLPVSKGGTGAVTAKGARQNLNTSIRPICINFGLVSSLPQTITATQNAAAADITADMIPQHWVFSNPAACPQGLKCTTALGSVTIGLPDSNATFSGETNVYLELVNPHIANDGGSGQEQNQSAADYVQITSQTLTTQQKSQARDNIGAASAEILEVTGYTRNQEVTFNQCNIYRIGRVIFVSIECTVPSVIVNSNCDIIENLPEPLFTTHFNTNGGYSNFDNAKGYIGSNKVLRLRPNTTNTDVNYYIDFSYIEK